MDPRRPVGANALSPHHAHRELTEAHLGLGQGAVSQLLKAAHHDDDSRFCNSPNSPNSPTMAPTTAPERREFVHPDASHAKKKYALPLPRLESVANHRAPTQSPQRLWHPAHFRLLLVPRRRPRFRLVRPDSRLRRDIQLLGADALPLPWLRAPDMGIFSRLCHPELALHRAACDCWECAETAPSVDKGLCDAASGTILVN